MSPEGHGVGIQEEQDDVPRSMGMLTLHRMNLTQGKWEVGRSQADPSVFELMGHRVGWLLLVPLAESSHMLSEHICQASGWMSAAHSESVASQ